MKNIGVLTHCIADNYGANLQALSTACYLKNKGYNPVFFKWDPYPENNNDEQLNLHRTFLERQGFAVTEKCVTDEDFIRCILSYNIDFVIVGSDCVLTYSKPLFKYALSRRGFVKKKPLIDWVFPNPFWMPYLSNTPNLRAAIMSGSCGGSDLKRASGETREKMCDCLNAFSYISVRDGYTKQSLIKILGSAKTNKISITPDPVFALNQNLKEQPTKESVLSKFNLPEKYVVAGFYDHYMPSDSWLGKLKDSLNRKGLVLVNLPMPQGGKVYSYDRNISLPLDSLDWYYLIKFSSGYIGNNMHPIIVSIHNGVPFYSINAHGRYFLRNLIQTTKHTKEYELLKRFNFLDYHTPCKQIERVNPDKVVESLIGFDKSYCLSCSKVLLDEYNLMMTDILNLI